VKRATHCKEELVYEKAGYTNLNTGNLVGSLHRGSRRRDYMVALLQRGSLTGVTIPSGVTSIGFLAFGSGGYFSRRPIRLTVTEGSYAEEYAKKNHHPHVFASE